MNIKEATGVVLKSLRQRNGMSQESVASKFGHGRQWISDIEKGKQSILWNDIRRIAIIYGVSIEYIDKEVDQLMEQHYK